MHLGGAFAASLGLALAAAPLAAAAVVGRGLVRCATTGAGHTVSPPAAWRSRDPSDHSDELWTDPGLPAARARLAASVPASFAYR